MHSYVDVDQRVCRFEINFHVLFISTMMKIYSGLKKTASLIGIITHHKHHVLEGRTTNLYAHLYIYTCMYERYLLHKHACIFLFRCIYIYTCMIVHCIYMYMYIYIYTALHLVGVSPVFTGYMPRGSNGVIWVLAWV